MTTHLTDRERAVLALIESDPLIDAAAIAARLGTSKAAVAVHISALTRKGRLMGRGYVVARPRSVLVVGGANLDVKCRTTGPALPGTSNPGSVVTAPGGVARNVAENLARLGQAVRLITALGQDGAGEEILARTAAAGVDTSLVHRSQAPTGAFSAVLGPDGDLVIGVAAMTAMEELTPERLHERRGALAAASMIVADTNLRPETLLHVARAAAERGTPMAVEPVSVAKAQGLAAVLDAGLPVSLATPNAEEAGALSGIDPHSPNALPRMAAALHARGIARLVIGLGPRGAYVSDAGTARRLAPVEPSGISDTTGAGDAALAATVAGLMAGLDLVAAAQCGQRAAALTIASPDTVARGLCAEAIGLSA